MRRMGKVLTIGGLIAALVLGTLNAVAYADGVPDSGTVFTRVPAPAPAQRPAAAKPSWTGCQIGGFAGYGVETQRSADDAGLVQFDMSTAADAALGGLAGVCHVAMEKAVVGAFADIAWTNADAQFSLPVNFGDGVVGDIALDHIVTVGGRLGYLLAPKVMVYGLAGYTWASTKTVIASYESGNLGDKEGWTVGAGIETLIGDHWSLGIEYRFTDLGDDTFRWSDAPDSVADVDANLHQGRVGLFYRF